MMASAPHTPAQGVPVPVIGFAPMPAVTETLAAFVAQLRYEQLPARAAEEGKLAIFV